MLVISQLWRCFYSSSSVVYYFLLKTSITPTTIAFRSSKAYQLGYFGIQHSSAFRNFQRKLQFTTRTMTTKLHSSQQEDQLESTSGVILNEKTLNGHTLQHQRVIPRLCRQCHGEGKIQKLPSKKARIRHQKKLKQTKSQGEDNQQTNTTEQNPTNALPKTWFPCKECDSIGLLYEHDTPENTSNGDIMVSSSNIMKNPNLHVAIIGGGIGGLALGAALCHRHISCTIYEKDMQFDQRQQGYGLTLQQARRALMALGIYDNVDNENCTTSLLQDDAVTSTKHLVHTSDGTVVAEWGLRKWGHGRRQNIQNDYNTTAVKNIDNNNNVKPRPPKRQNLHLPRQKLRYSLLEAFQEAAVSSFPCSNFDTVDNSDANCRTIPSSSCRPSIAWGHKLVDIQSMTLPETDHQQQHSSPTTKIKLTFHVTSNGQVEDGNYNVVTEYANFVVGCDGIRSKVRPILLGDDTDAIANTTITPTPLRYLNCIVILGICPLDILEATTQRSPLLDGETVFQTADGKTRIYLMPYSKKKREYMWQLSYPIHDENIAKELSRQGPTALKQEALNKCQSWHSPIPEILNKTPVELVSGYPVYDRDLLTTDILADARKSSKDHENSNAITLLGDAAHPMSPFKGQGANQALLDALSLARSLRRLFVREDKSLLEAIEDFETEMVERSSKKVKASSEAVRFLHSEIAISTGDVTRGGAAAAAIVKAMTEDDKKE